MTQTASTSPSASIAPYRACNKACQISFTTLERCFRSGGMHHGDDSSLSAAVCAIANDLNGSLMFNRYVIRLPMATDPCLVPDEEVCNRLSHEAPASCMARHAR